jgi:hypothetical protein
MHLSSDRLEILFMHLIVASGMMLFFLAVLVWANDNAVWGVNLQYEKYTRSFRWEFEISLASQERSIREESDIFAWNSSRGVSWSV